MSKDYEVEILPDKIKYLTSIAIFFEDITFGCAFNFFSPVLVEFKNKYDTDIETISKLFIVLALSYLVGAMSGGVLYGRVIRRQHGVLLTFIGISSTLFLTPYCSTILILFINLAILGFCCGAYDTAQTVWMMEMWQSRSGPFLQAQHFCFGLGTMLPSIIVAPFLSDQSVIDLNATNNTHFEELNGHETASILSKERIHEDANLHIPFTIAAFIALLNALYELFLINFYKYQKPRREIMSTTANEDIKAKEEMLEKGGKQDDESDGQLQDTAKWDRIKLITLSCLFLGFYQGMEMCSIQFAPTLAQYGNLKLSEAQGALILTGLTGGFAAGRALGILVVLKVKPHIILCANLVLVLIGNSILLFWSDHSMEVLLLACILLGLGFSSMYACWCAFLERHLTFTDAISSILLVCGSVVGIIYPMIVGKFIEQNPDVVTYTTFLSIVLCSVAFAVTYFLTTRKHWNNETYLRDQSKKQ